MAPFERLERQLIAALRLALAGGKPMVPEAGRLLWSFFVELSSSRTGNGFGPNPISYAEIEAWSRLHRWPLSDGQIAILRAMDRAWLEYAHVTNEPGAHVVSSQPMTAELFDAMF